MKSRTVKGRSDEARANALIAQLELLPHPEGGHYREILRSPHTVVDERGRTRSALTAIYFLLAGNDVSRWHRLAADETWHFAAGAPLAIDRIAPDGAHARCVLSATGPWFATIPAGETFAAALTKPQGFTLVTCCVAPGFAFEDFELVPPETLALRFPQHRAMLERYRRRRDR